MVKIKTVIVSDPVSHCEFDWSQSMDEVEMPPDMRSAFVSCGPQTLRYKEFNLYKNGLNAVPEGTHRVGDNLTTMEPLAPVNVDGLIVERTRVTNTSAGEDGQTRTSVIETWYSPELQEVVRQGSEKDGYTGFIKIQRKDVDPAFFTHRMGTASRCGHPGDCSIGMDGFSFLSV